MRPRIIHWVPILCYSGLIFFLSSRSIQAVPHDKWIHLLEYSVFGVLLAWPLSRSFGLKGWPLVFTVFVVGTFFGLSDEIHQYFVPGRTASVGDLLADGAGAFLGGAFYVAADWIRGTTPAAR